jgi:Carbohydrate family 9 binding domain-like/Domain of unknown function (DUF5916)
MLPRVLAAFIATSFATLAVAQVVTPNSNAFMRPTATAVRIDPSEAPTIDGDLSDPVWAKATVIDKFFQKDPVAGAPPTERTVLRILYDENNLYFGVYNYDSHPDQIIARSMQRDGPLYTADSFVIQIDPGQTRHNAYSFEVGASGGRTDEVELNNTDELTEWNTIWEAKVKRVSDGWTAEVVIPFRDLSFDPAHPNWGFDFSRRIRHKAERVYWSGWNPRLNFTDISQNGNLDGIHDIDLGLGLDLQVYGTTHVKRDWQNPVDRASLSFAEGGNAFYKITPALTGTLTINPDFSDAPLDVRQVNTTRFSLFTPETRQFFLQDVDAFEFGGHNFLRNSNDSSDNNGRPFFSRNIGLVNGNPVTLLGGGKLSGTFDGFGIGALSVRTNSTPFVGAQQLTTVRVIRPILSQSKVGLIFTNGDPTGKTDNTVAGGDLQYYDPSFFGTGQIVTADAYYERSFSSAVGSDSSMALALGFPNQPWGGDFVFKQVGKDFAPALGFVNRTGIRLYEGLFDNLTRYRDPFWNQVEFDVDYQFVTGLDSQLQSRSEDGGGRIQITAGDQFYYKLINSFEWVPMTFDLPGNVPVFPGRYDWTNWDLRLKSFDGRPLAVDAEINCCRFYNGRWTHAKVSLAYRPNRFFEFLPSYEGTFIQLPTGDVNIHLVAIEAIINFIPDMNLDTQVQYDNISRSMAILSRFRWEYEPGDEIFVAFSQGAILDPMNFNFYAQRSLFTFRLGHTFRF